MIETLPQVRDKDVDYYLSLSYPILLVYDSEDDYWIARIPDLPGCTSDGSCPDEAVENDKDAQQAWIESCMEDGLEIPLPTSDSVFVSLQVTPPSHRNGVAQDEPC